MCCNILIPSNTERLLQAAVVPGAISSQGLWRHIKEKIRSQDWKSGITIMW
jgi:hypothetical protein